jgi:hypothetical protein
MAIATIDLTQDTVRTDRGAVKITITATGNNITGAVFAIEVLPRSSDSLDPIYRFSHVCSPSELVEFPDYEPEDECYFRTNCIEMIFDTGVLAAQTYHSIERDVNALVKEYNQLFALQDDAGGVVSDSLLYTEINTAVVPT